MRALAIAGASVGTVLAVMGGYVVYDTYLRVDPREELLAAAALIEETPGLRVEATRSYTIDYDEAVDRTEDGVAAQLWPEGEIEFEMRYAGGAEQVFSIEPVDLDLGYALVANADGAFVYTEPGVSIAFREEDGANADGGFVYDETRDPITIRELDGSNTGEEKSAQFPPDDYGPELFARLLSSLAADEGLELLGPDDPDAASYEGLLVEGDVAAWDLDFGRVRPQDGTGRIWLSDAGAPERMEFTVDEARFVLELSVLDEPTAPPVPEDHHESESNLNDFWWPVNTHQLSHPFCDRVEADGQEWLVVTHTWTLTCEDAVSIADQMVSEDHDPTSVFQSGPSEPIEIGGLECVWSRRVSDDGAWRPDLCHGPSGAVVLNLYSR
ncbi:hypothetical protein KIK06_10290 [Nocardiopsis sp. EMB25]|uniref:hypothetical protein n=1 Tax=Nocardiopsis sp. EMB25 TaxID=2835867 RepID=UPI00228474BA|nr:hypothetical protein [Nocardiopsis sp. EMB25]MCY9784282.1 hypothetical protein [Nocardiopsis sp. EMB25]